MRMPLRCPAPLAGLVSLPGLALLATLLASCSALPVSDAPVGLNPEPPTVGMSQGRVTVVVVDELGIAMSGMKVDLAWEYPSFYKTSSFTNRVGEVIFSGVPSVAEIRIDSPTGEYVRTLYVPQTGRPELRVMLDTMGEGELMRERERSRLMPPGAAPASR